MKSLMIGVVVGALAGASIGYLVWARQLSEVEARVAQLESKLVGMPTEPLRGNPNAAVITVKGAAGGPCEAKVHPFLIGDKRNNKVHWSVDSDDARCAGGNWRIELRFDNAADGTVWNGGVITINRGGGPPFKIPSNANIGKFPYHVWYVGQQGGTAYEMADPELQIEM